MIWDLKFSQKFNQKNRVPTNRDTSPRRGPNVKEVFLFLLFALFSLPLLGEEKWNYGFVVGDYMVMMRIESPQIYRGEVLSFVSPNDPKVCFSTSGEKIPCDQRKEFVGAVVVVRFKVEGKTLPKDLTLGEFVTTIGQDPRFPVRGDVIKSVPIDPTGVATDLQSTGYDESVVPSKERSKLRKDLKGAWVSYRQELYLLWDGGAQRHKFAIIEWRHTLDGATVERVQGVATPTEIASR